MKQEAIEFDFNNIHQEVQVPLFDEVKTEPAEEPEATCLDAPGNDYHGLQQNETNCKSDGHFEIAVDILDELISNAVEISKKTVTDHL